MPDPAILFVALCVAVILLSQVLAWTGLEATFEVVKPPPQVAEETYYGGSVQPTDVADPEPQAPGTYREVTETAEVKGLLTGEGVRYLFTSFVDNFRNFSAVAILMVVMVGVGLAEAAGLIGALIRKLVGVSSPNTLTFIIVFIGMLSSIASDAGYLVLIPLGGAAFMSVGRHPLAGIAAGFAGVGVGFGVNFAITPLDGVLTEITNDASGGGAQRIDLAANLWFSIASTLLITVVATVVTTRLVEGRLGRWDPAEGARMEAHDEPTAASSELEARGLRHALWATLGVVAVVALLTAPGGAPLRNPQTGDIIGDSPFMDSLIVIITAVFFAAGLAYGRGAGTIRASDDVLAAITKAWAGLASLLFLFLLIAQFIAYFSYSNIPEVLAVKLGDVLEQLSIGAVWLLIGVVVITFLVGIVIPPAIPKWALLAPIFIPLFVRLDVAPQTVLAAYRVGDSPVNTITPLMAYFPLIVVFAKRYRRDSGIGTVVSMMLPYTVVVGVVWTVFFVLWYLLGIPLGPGSPVHT
jgi:aminobenzoyl-glutamate transport protein